MKLTKDEADFVLANAKRITVQAQTPAPAASLFA